MKTKIYVLAGGLLVLSLIGGSWGYYNTLTDRENQRKIAFDACNAVTPITTSASAELLTATNAVSKDRLSRINAIYDSLKLGGDYKLVSSNVFGDKRVYEWDSGRTFSSSKDYEKCADVNNTVNELRKSIEAAGFVYFENPYPGSDFTELHFKSASNEYIRINVSSKSRNDAFRDNPNIKSYLDPNAGPSNVTIKVNLDDNNE